MDKLIRVLAVAALAMLLAGCEDWGDWGGDSGRYKEDFAYNYTLKPGGRLYVESLNGAVEVMGWDQDKVEITGTKYASTESTLQALRIDIVTTDDSIRVRTVTPSGHRGGMGAKYTLHVPRKTEIERIVTSNGRITVDDIDSAARLKTSNGSVRVNRTNGNLDVETSNAGVELTAHNGPAVVHTSNGSIKADGVRGFLDATTSNASINARLTDPEPGKPVKLESSNGSITVEVASYKANEIRASTSNAGITLKVPHSVNAQLRARTSNGSIQTDFDVNVRGTMSKNSMEGTIGSGGPMLELETSNGTIRLQRL